MTIDVIAHLKEVSKMVNNVINLPRWFVPDYH